MHKVNDLNAQLPKHIAIIMDGNGRWAEKQHKQRTYGHENAVSSVKHAINYCLKHKINYLTLYAFSTENWKRPQSEIDFLMDLIFRFLETNRQFLLQKKIQLRWLGKEEKLSQEHCKALYDIIEETQNFDELILSIAFNYGGRDEIIRAIKKMKQDEEQNKFNFDHLSEEEFARYLDTDNIIDPDLLIRTSGEQRISNFLIWQTAYTEFYFTDVCWPDFDEEQMQKAVDTYVQRNRKLGGVQCS